MAKKEAAAKKADKKETSKDIKIQGETSLNPQIGKWDKPYPEGNDEFKLTKNIEAILKKDISKSDKMRCLYRIQITSNKEITYWTNGHPSFVSTVVLKLKRQIIKEAK